ncbi:rhodopsin-like isoform X2 [Convolutriloba macropyga]
MAAVTLNESMSEFSLSTEWPGMTSSVSSSGTVITTGEEETEDWREVFYAPMPGWIHDSIGILLAILIYFGTHGNIITIHIFLSTKSLRTPQNLFLVNLAVVDLIMVLACQPIFCIASFLRYYPLDTCHIFGSFATFGGLCSINSMAIIAYDRYAMICSPPDKRTTPTMKRSLSIIGVVWGYTMIFAILPNVGVGGFIINGSRTSCSFDFISTEWSNRINLLLMYVCGFLFPLSFSIYCYASIFLKVKGSGGGGGAKATAGGAANDAKSHSKSKELVVAKASMMCIGVFIVTWFPYALIGVLGQLVGPGHLNPYVTTLPALIAKTNCIYNPVIFALAHPSFKKELKRRLIG